MNFGKKLKDLRMKKAVTQEQLATHLGLSPQAVSKWETDQALPDIQLLPEISIYFGVTVDELFDLTDQKHFLRIEHILEHDRDISGTDFTYAEQFLKSKLEQKESCDRSLTLLSSLYNAKADEYRRMAEYYARESLELAPEKKDNHSNLLKAQQGTIPDWDFSNHARRISYYQSFVKKNPDYIGGYLWLLDELIADNRLDEADQVLLDLMRLDDSCRVPLYEGMIAWARGDHAQAMEIWQAMAEVFSEDWLAQSSMGDCLARAGRYREAIPYYEKGLALQPAPRFMDSALARAQIYELLGEYDSAIHCLEEATELMRVDWDISEGEAIDHFVREISRLKELAQQME